MRFFSRLINYICFSAVTAALVLSATVLVLALEGFHTAEVSGSFCIYREQDISGYETGDQVIFMADTGLCEGIVSGVMPKYLEIEADDGEGETAEYTGKAKGELITYAENLEPVYNFISNIAASISKSRTNTWAAIAGYLAFAVCGILSCITCPGSKAKGNTAAGTGRKKRTYTDGNRLKRVVHFEEYEKYHEER